MKKNYDFHSPSLSLTIYLFDSRPWSEALLAWNLLCTEVGLHPQPASGMFLVLK